MNGTNCNTDERGLLPYPVILAATKGDPEAMNIVMQHYQSYIAHLSMRKIRDESGNTYYGIDEDLRERLQSKLMRAVLSFKADYGFNSRVEWCACFVSWCANECGYIENGIIPKFAGCIQGSEWFKERGQWQDGSFTPEAGHIIFFDWEGDGLTDHVGIVERVENGTVYTVEGNSGDACRQNSYAIGSSVIYGYGIPAY